ncbi:hypothetical protein Asn12ST33_05045 [Cutibacterium acnes]|nr:hypothetical protein Asn12ST33_05045 [Cutibacterium acnes]
MRTSPHAVYGSGARCVLAHKDAVVGLSKIPRLVQHIAVRPQMQERMTQSICEMIMGGLLPKVTHAYSKAFTRA